MTNATQYYTVVRNPKWLDSTRKKIDCEVNFNHVPFEEWTPFLADPNDYMPYSKMIFDECVSGQWGEIGEYTAPIGIPSSTSENVVDPNQPQPETTGSQNL